MIINKRKGRYVVKQKGIVVCAVIAGSRWKVMHTADNLIGHIKWKSQ